MRVLVVDDDSIAQLIIEKNLQSLPSLDAHIFKADNGRKAIEFIAKEEVDVVL